MNWWHRNVPALGGFLLGGYVVEQFTPRQGVVTWGPIFMGVVIWISLDFTGMR